MLLFNYNIIIKINYKFTKKNLRVFMNIFEIKVFQKFIIFIFTKILNILFKEKIILWFFLKFKKFLKIINDIYYKFKFDKIKKIITVLNFT